MRHDPTRPLVLDGPQAWVEPRWDAERGEPYLGGLRVMVRGEAWPAVTADIPLSYFGELARALRRRWLPAANRSRGEALPSTACARLPGRVIATATARPADDMFSVCSEPQEIALGQRVLGVFLANSQLCGPAGPRDARLHSG